MLLMVLGLKDTMFKCASSNCLKYGAVAGLCEPHNVWVYRKWLMSGPGEQL